MCEMKIEVDFDGHLLQQRVLDVTISEEETLSKSFRAFHRLTRTTRQIRPDPDARS